MQFIFIIKITINRIMSSFFYTKNKYIITFNHNDLLQKEIQSVLKECTTNLNKDLKIHIDLSDAKDINVINLIALIELIWNVKKKNAVIKFRLSEELKELLIKSNIYKLFENE